MLRTPIYLEPPLRRPSSLAIQGSSGKDIGSAFETRLLQPRCPTTWLWITWDKLTTRKHVVGGLRMFERCCFCDGHFRTRSWQKLREQSQSKCWVPEVSKLTPSRRLCEGVHLLATTTHIMIQNKVPSASPMAWLFYFLNFVIKNSDNVFWSHFHLHLLPGPSHLSTHPTPGLLSHFFWKMKKNK